MVPRGWDRQQLYEKRNGTIYLKDRVTSAKFRNIVEKCIFRGCRGKVVPSDRTHRQPHITSTPVLICTHRASHTSYINTRAHLHTASHTSYINTRAYLHTEPATHHTSTPVLICWGDAHHGQTCGGGGEGYPWLPHRTPPRAKRGNSPPQVWYCAHFRTCVAQRADPRTRSFRQKAKARTTSPSTPCFQRRAQLT